LSIVRRKRGDKEYLYFQAGRKSYIYLGSADNSGKDIKYENVLKAIEYLDDRITHYGDVRKKLTSYLPKPEELDRSPVAESDNIILRHKFSYERISIIDDVKLSRIAIEALYWLVVYNKRHSDYKIDPKNFTFQDLQKLKRKILEDDEDRRWALNELVQENLIKVKDDRHFCITTKGINLLRSLLQRRLENERKFKEAAIEWIQATTEYRDLYDKIQSKLAPDEKVPLFGRTSNPEADLMLPKFAELWERRNGSTFDIARLGALIGSKAYDRIMRNVREKYAKGDDKIMEEMMQIVTQ
jgi:hypothetical protein